GMWLDIDKYIDLDTSKNGHTVHQPAFQETGQADPNLYNDVPAYILHTPRGDVIYDGFAMIHDAGAQKPQDLTRAYRTRPFDGTFLVPDVFDENNQKAIKIVTGNPADTRSLTEWYTPYQGNNASIYRLSELSKASIYHGKLNRIAIQRTYDSKGVSVTFDS